MKNFISSVSIFLIFISSNSKILAQSDFSIQIRGGTSPIEKKYILKYWNSGWNVGAGVEYKIFSMVFMSGDVIFHSLSFKENSTYSSFTYGGLQNRSLGKDANLYEASLAFRFVRDQGVVRPFAILRSGIYIVHTGKIIFIDWYEPYPGFQSDWHIKVMNEERINRWFVSLGIGVQIPLSNSLNILIEQTFSQTTSGDLTLFPLNAVVQFDI